jgi:hypothetical protein
MNGDGRRSRAKGGKSRCSTNAALEAWKDRRCSRGFEGAVSALSPNASRPCAGGQPYERRQQRGQTGYGRPVV